MAKKKIRNMTRAEHKKGLERAVQLQSAAIQEEKGKIFLPRLGKYGGDLYAQVIEAGQELIRKGTHIGKEERVMSYYSRRDIQEAMYQYAKGRKISVLRNFSPMFGGSTIRKPDDILPIMVFYSQEGKLWPSIHGTISRYNSDGRFLCDLVLEIDFKKNFIKCFDMTRPIVRILLAAGVEFRVKYSGNASAHVIIPGEAFHERWRRGNKCYELYGKLFNFFKNYIKGPGMLDGSFRRPNHFLRMPYSLNENTGLVSVPIDVEDYDRFSWKHADPETVEVIEDWWNIPDDAPERTESLIDMVISQRTSIALRSDINTKIKRDMPQDDHDVISSVVRMGMIKTGENAIDRAAKFSDSEKAALDELLAVTANDESADQRQLIRIIAQKHGINRDDLQVLWRWSDRLDISTYYSRGDVQEAIYDYAKGRYVCLKGIDGCFTLENPSDIYALAGYAISEGINPVFRCSSAKYDPDDGRMISCDAIIQVDQMELEISDFDMPCFLLYSDPKLYIVVPFEAMATDTDAEPLPSRLLALEKCLSKHVRNTLKRSKLSLDGDFIPIPYSILDDGKSVSLPIRLDDIYDFLPSMARINEIGTVKSAESLILSNSNVSR